MDTTQSWLAPLAGTPLLATTPTSLISCKLCLQKALTDNIPCARPVFRFEVVCSMVRLKYGDDRPLSHALIAEAEASLSSLIGSTRAPAGSTNRIDALANKCVRRQG